MIAQLVNTAFAILFWLFMLYVMLALLGLKWRPFRRLRDGYAVVLKVLVVSAATFLWKPAFQRDGIGNLVDAPGERERS